ncbi:hypothetical protein BHE90_013957 [Fusarium euwallaceae]|uniref:RRM domain-containing protein n=2 Tax=Fusarium solani species complex TaxID=232080 RepID=A0A3M2RAP8_9HYPO|nr:hypothetical protein CDV36_015412 [Fusarium kuroshium]RTE71649.1 hypothetical protein BHE90_013957 [Fusarium euwallaceae]
MSAEQTVPVDVAPGDQTGVYYITICNLSFGVQHQELKDWIHSKVVCKVDFVQIFSGSTSGWVRLRGKDNFKKAWGVLNGGDFNGRSIIADDRNRTQTITIKMRNKAGQPDPQQLPPPVVVYSQPQDHEKLPPPVIARSQPQDPKKLPPPVIARSQPPGSHPAAQDQQAAAASSATSTQYSSAPGQYYAAGYNQAGGPSYSGQFMPMQDYPPQPPATIDPREYYNYSGANAGPSSGVGYSPSYQYDGTQFALPYHGQQEAPAYYTGATDAGAGAAGGSVPGQEPAYQAEPAYVAAEARKLHVSPFPQNAPREGIRRWIMHKIYEKQTVQDIDIPMNRNGQFLRGHVFVVFDSAASATKAMELLNKARYQGAKIIARSTVEGVTANEATMSFQAPKEADLAPARIPTGPRDDRHRGDRPQRPKHRESNKGASADRKRSSDKKSSSSTKKSSKTPSKKTLPDKKGSSSTKDAGPPLVVDGTSRRGDKR